MALTATPPPAGHEDGSPASSQAQHDREHSEAPKASYKSMKKKYRKIRHRFEKIMKDSDAFYKQEQAGLDTIKRLAHQNDHLLDILLDNNNQPLVAATSRVNLDLDTVKELPPFVGDADLAGITTDTTEGRELYDELKTLIAQHMEEHKPVDPPGRSFTQLENSIPHRSAANGQIPPELASDVDVTGKGDTVPVSYPSLDQLDDYLYDLDVTLGIPLLSSHAPTASAAINGAHTTPVTSDKDLLLRNPNSVYNWLRKHEPGIFLQDNDSNEKASGKSGAARGGGGAKRAGGAANRAAESVEFVEEDGLTYSGTPKEVKGKRKREEDPGYKPKSGSARPSKKKRKSEIDDGTLATPSAGKGRRKPRESDASALGGSIAED